MFDIALTQLINQMLRAETLIPQCRRRTSERVNVCTRCSRQCNQAKCAITHKVDLTTGHLAKLKTRHLLRTRSLRSITPIRPDWLLGELELYKWSNNPCGRYERLISFQHRRLSSSPVVFSSQKVSTVEKRSMSSYTAFSSDTNLRRLFRNNNGTFCLKDSLKRTCKNETGHLVPLSG